MTNSGTIEGGGGGKGSPSGAAGDAIYSAGADASIGPITNSGKIIGNVEIDNQASVTVTGGAGKPFGKWTGGTITIGNGDLTFVRNTALGDDISVDGGKGTVTNMGRLRLAAPETIAGNFTQAPAGVLVLNFAGDVFGEYGALTVTKLTTLDGRLTIRLTDGFTLTKGDSFDILGFRQPRGPGFDALTLDGARLLLTARGHLDLRRRRASEGGHRPHVAGPLRGAWLGRIRTGGLVAHPRTIDLGDARAGLPRPRRPRPAQTQEGGRDRATRRATVSRSASPLLDRGHRLAGQPGESDDLLSEGYRLGRGGSVLQGVPVALRSAASGTVHAADFVASNCWRVGTASRSFSTWRGISTPGAYAKSMGLNLRFFARPHPLCWRVDVADDRLPALANVDVLDGHLLLAL